MSAFTVFKIASMLSLSWSRCQLFSSSSQYDGGSKNDNVQNGPTPNPQLVPSDCSKNKVSANCLMKSCNANYMEYLFSKWDQNPKSVHNSWNVYFSDVFHDHQRKLENCVQVVSPQEVSSQNVAPAADEEGNESDEQNYLDLFQKLNKATASKTVKAIQAKQQISKSEKDAVWITNQQPQKPDCVFEYITSSPKFDDDKEKDTVKDTSKPKATPNRQQTYESVLNKNRAKTEQSFIEDEYERAMKCVNMALKQRQFITRREYIKAQLKLIVKKKMQKSLERKKRKANGKTVAKNCKSTEKLQK